MSATDKRLCILFDEELPLDLFPPEKSLSEILKEINKKLRWEGPSGRLEQQPNIQNIPRPVVTNYLNQDIDLTRQRMMETYRNFFLNDVDFDRTFYQSIPFQDQER